MARARAIDTRLEKLIPSTDELFVAGVFTKEEIQQIVKQRTFHEYKLVARPLLLIDVKNAINFELGIEKKISEYCLEYNRQAAREASGLDENGKRVAKKSGAPLKKLKLKHRWAVQERIESIYRIGLKHLFTQRKTASLLQLKRKSTLTTAPLTGVASAKATTAGETSSMDDYETLRRECVLQLKIFCRQSSLSKLYADWLTRSPQDAFLWSEAALFEAQNGRNDEARAIIQQALATLRQSQSSSATAGASAKATSTISVRLAGKDFAKQKASEEAKEVWGTALLIEILFAKRLLEGAIETAVRNDDKTPADSLRGENAALAAIVLDLALAEAVVSDCASAQSSTGEASSTTTPFLCPDLGLHLYSIAVCYQFTASLCRSILLQTLAVAAAYNQNNKTGASNNTGYNPFSTLLTELFLTDIRFAATNCVSAEKFIEEKTLGDLALLQKRSNGDELRREWVVRHLHRKHRVISIAEKKERVLSSIGGAMTLIVAIQSVEKALSGLDKKSLEAIVTEASSDDKTETNTTTTLFSALLQTILCAGAAAVIASSSSKSTTTTPLASLAGLRSALSDAIVELLSLSRDLIPIHLDDAQSALVAYENLLAKEKEEKKEAKEKAAKKRAREGDDDDGKEGDDKEDDIVDFADPNAFLKLTASNIFLFSQSESSKILRLILLTESASAKPLAIVAAIEKATNAILAGDDKDSDAAGKKTKKGQQQQQQTDSRGKKEAMATLDLFRELCLAAALLSTTAAADETEEKNEKNNRRVIVRVGSNGANLLKQFVEVAFNSSAATSAGVFGANGDFSPVVTTISQQSTNLALAAASTGDGEEADEEALLEDAFAEDVSPLAGSDKNATTAASTKTFFTRDQLWWASPTAVSPSTASGLLSLIDTKFLSVRMTSVDLVTFLNLAQPSAATRTTTDGTASSKKKAAAAVVTTATAAPVLNLSTREEVETHISRVLALIDNEASLALSTAAAAAPATPAAATATSSKKKGAAAPAPTTAAVPTPSSSCDIVIPKLVAAIQTIVCTPQPQKLTAASSSTSAAASGGSYLPYDPSLWRLFTALQHALGEKLHGMMVIKNKMNVDNKKKEKLIGSKTVRNDDDGESSEDDSDSDEEGAKKKVAKKKLRVGGTAASSSAVDNSMASSSSGTATSVISQRDELMAITREIVNVVSGENNGDVSKQFDALTNLARRLYHASLQIVAGGCSHASLPTSELRVERLKGILAVTVVEIIREMEAVVDSSSSATAVEATPSRIGFNSPAIFLGAQVLRFQQLLAKVAALPATPALHGNVHTLISQFTRVHNLLLPPIRVLDQSNTRDALGHGYSTPITRALLKNVLIPCYAAAHTAVTKALSTAALTAAAPSPAAKAQLKTLIEAAEKVLHSLIAQLTSLYLVEAKEAGKFGNGIKNSTQYAIVQRKEVSDFIVQNRVESFLPFFFPLNASENCSMAAAAQMNALTASASVTKSNITNAQVDDWLLALVFEQQYTKNLAEAKAVHGRAVQTVEAPQTFLASVAGGVLPTLF